MWSGRVNPFIESDRVPFKPSRDIAPDTSASRVRRFITMQREPPTAPIACVPFSSAKAFLYFRIMFYFCSPEGLIARQTFAFIERFAFAHHHECKMGEGRQVPAGSDRPFLRNDGVTPAQSLPTARRLRAIERR